MLPRADRAFSLEDGIEQPLLHPFGRQPRCIADPPDHAIELAGSRRQASRVRIVVDDARQGVGAGVSLPENLHAIRWHGSPVALRQTGMKPGLFIVGAPKCGTTAWVKYLGEHAQIAFSKIKEPHYFALDLPGFREVETQREYEALFSADAPIQGEAS